MVVKICSANENYRIKEFDNLCWARTAHITIEDIWEKKAKKKLKETISIHGDTNMCLICADKSEQSNKTRVVFFSRIYIYRVRFFSLLNSAYLICENDCLLLLLHAVLLNFFSSCLFGLEYLERTRFKVWREKKMEWNQKRVTSTLRNGSQCNAMQNDVLYRLSNNLIFFFFSPQWFPR